MKTLATLQASNVQIIGTTDDPLFKAADVATGLGLANSRQAIKSLPDDEKRGVIESDSTGRKRKLLFVTEAGFWRLCFKSRKPQAKALQDHVYKVLLPNWRRGHGAEQGIPPRVPPQLTEWRNARLQFRLRLCKELLQHDKWGEFTRASDRIAKRDGISGGSLRRWYYRWRKSDFDDLSLIFPSLIYGWNHPAALPTAPEEPLQIAGS